MGGLPLDLHQLTKQYSLSCCHVIKTNLQSITPSSHAFQNLNQIHLELQSSIDSLIVPSLQKHLHLSSEDAALLKKIQVLQYKSGDIESSYTEYNQECETPVIHLQWSGSTKDLVVLAHEYSHAVQILLSKKEFMPPIVREVCAFMGELMLIDYSKRQSQTLYQALCETWRIDNLYYLGKCTDDLLNSLEQQEEQYVYWHNYPLARAMAMATFTATSRESMTSLFASGSSALRLVVFSKILPVWKESQANYLSRNNNNNSLELKMSLSPDAWDQIDSSIVAQTWLTSSIVKCASLKQVIEPITKINATAWVKWRSLGLYALAAIENTAKPIKPASFIDKYEESASEEPNSSIILAMPWLRPKEFDALTALGMVVYLLATSPYHKKFSLPSYLPIEIIPPIQCRQFYCFVDEQGNPVGLVTWAWLSKITQQNVHDYGRALLGNEWVQGSNLFFNDWIVDARVFRSVMGYMTKEIFPNEVASSLRRNQDGSVRRVNKWKGKTAGKV